MCPRENFQVVPNLTKRIPYPDRVFHIMSNMNSIENSKWLFSIGINYGPAMNLGMALIPCIFSSF